MDAETQLFAYGSLMFQEVWWHVVGRELNAQPATLSGHQVYTVAGYSFPGLVESEPADQVEGLLISNITTPEWARLDAFEDSFYLRQAVTVEVAGGETAEASTYLVPAGRRSVLSDRRWDRERFEQEHLAAFVDRICGFEPDVR